MHFDVLKSQLFGLTELGEFENPTTDINSYLQNLQYTYVGVKCKRNFPPKKIWKKKYLSRKICEHCEYIHPWQV